jgi:hypothetical protein
MRIAMSSEVSIEVVLGRPAAEYDRRRVEAAEHLLSRDAVTLATNPERRAKLHGIAAVNAARIGDPERARRHAVAAVRAQPTSRTALLRLVAVLVPGLAARRWSANQQRGRVGFG